MGPGGRRRGSARCCAGRTTGTCPWSTSTTTPGSGRPRIVLAGQVTEQCILYSALDAYLRDFTVVVPRDAVAHIHPHLAEAALEMMGRNLHAEVTGGGRALLTASVLDRGCPATTGPDGHVESSPRSSWSMSRGCSQTSP